MLRILKLKVVARTKIVRPKIDKKSKTFIVKISKTTHPTRSSIPPTHIDMKCYAFVMKPECNPIAALFDKKDKDL